MKVTEEKDDDDDSSTDTNEALEFLLGGLALQDLSAASWETDAEKESEVAETANNSKSMELAFAGVEPNKAMTTTPKAPLPCVKLASSHDDTSDFLFSKAYTCSGYCTPNGKIERPPVQVMETKTRGNTLIVTRPIASNQVLFTEQAAVASQVPTTLDDNSVGFSVRACHYCFCSLEPISKLQVPEAPSLPSPQLWPVPDFEFDETDHDTEGRDEAFRHDTHGRIVCRTCDTTFCSRQCQTKFEKELGSCCALLQVVQALPKLLSNTTNATDDSDHYVPVQSALVLGVRMFVMALQRHRSGNIARPCWDGLCGDASDVTPLELGVCQLHNNDNTHVYTLEPVYNFAVVRYQLDATECETLSLDFLHTLASRAARNGVDLVTQSPFSVYYVALVRQVGGRGGSCHTQIKQQVAHALGKQELERGMDQYIESLVAPEIVALFPLTARINHACHPNAQVQSQVFCDARLDLVALRDLSTGEEICISYIPVGPSVGRKTTSRRRRELQAKYFFWCECDQCLQEQQGQGPNNGGIS